ncbi:hypothetical protein [Haliscomenobacter hydrossis]|uniref:Uncharacterized protein n=1 Tax=Haliscomenobacter hydrossis (strain ATCC 27775 / DSM 1100 / LMG 10767 / O) TaxID=760192 RepID=F4KVN5_HALH1|nr:hypothetical protein [Haliscomenobacter hydrossis]AEE52492.1 hypothetical protein Halhy_4657 [Haliscomenobacter hydrossis DSM 1100]
MKKITWILLSLLILFSLEGCLNFPEPNSQTIKQKTINLIVGTCEGIIERGKLVWATSSNGNDYCDWQYLKVIQHRAGRGSIEDDILYEQNEHEIANYGSKQAKQSNLNLRNVNRIVGKWETILAHGNYGGHLYITWNIQSNGIWTGITYADIAKTTRTFSTKWRLEGNNLYDVGDTEDFLYVIQWIDQNTFKVIDTKGMVLNSIFERNISTSSTNNRQVDRSFSHSGCRFCDGSGYSNCQTCGGSGEVIGIGYNKETYNNISQRYEYHWVQPYNRCVYCTNGKVTCINRR